MLANRQADVHEEYLLPTGYGDGGGGPTAEMLERARRLGSLPGMPAIEWDHPETFFERLDNVRDQLPVHQGECYLEYHRGTYTTHGNLKASFRRLERALQTAEAVASLSSDRWDMTDTWKRLVFSQFHDYIPGTSVWNVYREGLPELEQLAEQQLSQAQQALNGKGTSCLFNPHAVPLRQWVQTKGAKKPCFVSLPPLSGSELAEAALPEPEPVTLEQRAASNGLVQFRLNSSGWIDRLSWENVDVPLTAPLGQLISYADKAAHFESWDIDRHVLSQGEVARSKATIKPIDEGPRAGFEVTRRVGAKSEATVRFLLEAGSPLLHVEIDLDWQEPETLLKLLIPTQYSSTQARFGAPYGSVQRSQVCHSLSSEAMWEVPFSRYLAVYDDSECEGLFTVTENKYGATVREGKIGISLVRSPRVTGYDNHDKAWPPHLSRLQNTPTYSDLGKHRIDLALGRYAADLPRARHPASLADTLFTKPIPYTGTAISGAIQNMAGGESLIPCWVKPARNRGYILRLHEVGGRRGQLRLSLRPGWTLTRTDIGESKEEPCEESISFKPYEVVSLLLQSTEDSADKNQST
jgi:alpha-mannosidase